jgi:hypothetical protein
MAQGERPEVIADPEISLSTTSTAPPADAEELSLIGPPAVEGTAEPGTGEAATGQETIEDAAALKARIAVLEQELAVAQASAADAQADAAAAQAAAAEAAVARAESSALVTAAPAKPTGPRQGRWRPWVVGVLLVLTVPLAISTVVARWAHNEIGNTDRYVATVAPLANDPAIQQEMVDKVSAAIFSRFDVQAVTTEAIDALEGQGLPPRAVATLDALTVPLVSGIQSFVNDQVTKIVQSDRFETAWIAANERAHTQLVAVLTGEGTDTVSVDGGKVTLNIGPIIEQVKAALVNAGFGLADRIPSVSATFTILESENLANAQTGFSVLSTMAVVLPFLLLLVVGLAIGLARDRRRTLVIAALTIAGSMLVLGLSLNLFRPFYLNHVPPEVLSTPAAAAIFDAMVHFLRLALRIVVVAMLAIVLVAWLVGPTRSARGLRGFTAKSARAIGSTTSKAGGSAAEGVHTGAAGLFAREHLLPLRIGIAGVAVLLIAVPDGPSSGYVITIIVLAVLAWLGVEFLARTAPPTVDAVTLDATAEAAPEAVNPEAVNAASGG